MVFVALVRASWKRAAMSPMGLFVVVVVVLVGRECAASMTNSWAVQLRVGDADALAKKHGFVNLGLVSYIS